MTHWLTNMREKAGYSTIRGLADDSGVDISTLSRIEQVDGPQPTTKTLKKIAPYLKVPYIKLLALSGHLGDDPESQKLAKFYEDHPDAVFIDEIPGDPFGVGHQKNPLSSTIEGDWPEVANVLRRAGKIPTPEERAQIARIIRATLGEEEKERK